MFAIFLFVRTMNKMRDKKPANTHACPYCKSTINNAATKCPFCCSEVEVVETGAVVESDLKKGIKSATKLVSGVADKALRKIKKIKKITKRWLLNSFSLILITLIIIVLVMAVSVRSYYYNTARQFIEYRVRENSMDLDKFAFDSSVDYEEKVLEIGRHTDV